MRIKKTSNNRPRTSQTINVESNSTTDAYSCDYSNKRNTYSTDETFTGKYWIDGKPIYRKVFNIPKSSVNSGSTTTFIHNLSISTYISVNMFSIRTDNYMVPFPNSLFGTSNDAWHTKFGDFTPNQITFSIGTSQYAQLDHIEAIFEYTKTN